MALESVHSAALEQPALTTGSAGNGDYRCAECGYGIVAFRTLPTCPMCRGTQWLPQRFSPFAGRGSDA
jgi:rubrerythrin